MKILITNDDGINSPGLQNLSETLKKDHDIWVLAPSGDRSGVSQSLTMREPVKIIQKGEQSWSCSGTPTDCVVYGTEGFFPADIDLVLSGINLGPNLGTDLLYSGTAAAARQASLHGIPAIAISVNQFKPPFNFQEISDFVAEQLDELVALWDDSCFFNMNFPAEMDVDSHLEWTWPARRVYHDDVVKMESPRGEGTYCFLKGNVISSQEEEGSDVLAVKRGNISISAISICPTVVPHIGNIRDIAEYCH